MASAQRAETGVSANQYHQAQVTPRRMPPRADGAPRNPRRPEVLQQALFVYHEDCGASLSAILPNFGLTAFPEIHMSPGHP